MDTYSHPSQALSHPDVLSLQHAEVILPEVVKALAGLKQGWLDADSNPATTYDCMLELLTSTRE